MISGAVAPTASALGLTDTLALRQRGDGAVQPAAFRVTRRQRAALEHVLAVEMRALAIVGGGGVDDERLARVVKAREIRHRRMEAEEVVEPRGRGVAIPAQRERAVQAGVFGIADRRDGRKPVERAAQHDDDEPRVARAGRARKARDRGIGEARAGAGEEAPSWDQRKRKRHGYLLWNSGDNSSSA